MVKISHSSSHRTHVDIYRSRLSLTGICFLQARNTVAGEAIGIKAANNLDLSVSV